mmetsp:Transcript_11403/g.32024  ORF Transcript_11403/g.32024 Transcript_11403/m.32024 type:complete len:257 (-) Transcript_11403:991-1761(-)
MSTTMASTTVIREATEAASTRAVFTTLVGSRTPDEIMSQYSPFWASKPKLQSSCSSTFPATIDPSYPALDAIVLMGVLRAFSIILTPCRWSKFAVSTFARTFTACSRATPPPGTIPSLMAALVAFSASSTRSFFSPTSTSLAPPQLMTATPPDSLARRSSSLPFSYWLVVRSINSRIISLRSSIAASSPAPSRIVVVSLVISTDLAVPRCAGSTASMLSPTSSLTTVAPVWMAMSCTECFRLSPNPGDFTAATFRP